MKLFKKKKEDEESEDEDLPEKLPKAADGSIQVAKLAAKVESLLDIRKSYSERFTAMSEQIGEVRGMVLDTSKQIQKLEVDSTKAIELVKEVQPEQFMSVLRKQEASLEALKASLESKEAVMHDITEELHKVRKQMSFYRGIEQVTELNKEIKKDLISIKKVQSVVERHADKVESIFIDLQKKYGELDSYAGTLEELRASVKDALHKVDTFTFGLEEKAGKKAVADLSNKMDAFISDSRLEKLQTFTHDIANFRKRAEDNFALLKTVKQRTDDVYLALDEADIHQLKQELKNVAKARDLLELDVKANKDLLKKLSRQHIQYAKLETVMKQNKQLSKQVTELLATQASLKAKEAKMTRLLNESKEESEDLQKGLSKIRSLDKRFRESTQTFQDALDVLSRRMHRLEQGRDVSELKNLRGGLSSLQQALGKRRRTRQKTKRKPPKRGTTKKTPKNKR